MKTSVILKSESRELLGTIIKQRTEDSFLCLTDLQNAYDKARIEFGWSDRRINDIVSTQSFKTLLYHNFKNNNKYNTYIDFNNYLKLKGINNYLKSINLWVTKGRGKSRCIWIDCSLWNIIFEFLFSRRIDSPDWIINLPIITKNYLFKPLLLEERLEKVYLKSLIEKFGMFCQDIEYQFKIENKFYDMKINVLGVNILIEYNEKSHNNSSIVKNDLIKSNLALKHDYKLFVIEENKEKIGENNIIQFFKHIK